MLLPANFLIGAGLLGAILLGDAICAASAAGCWLPRSCCWRSVRIFAARELVALSPGAAVSAVGRRARRAGRHRRARRFDRCRIYRSRMAEPSSERAADRIFAAAALAHRYPNARIVFSGGSANLIANDRQGSRLCGRDVRKPRHCQSAADHGAALAQHRRKMPNSPKRSRSPKSGERWLLVTSAFHMPRSVGLFRKAGFAVEPYPVDWRVGGRSDLLQFSTIASTGSGRTDVADARMDRPCRLSGHRQDRSICCRDRIQNTLSQRPWTIGLGSSTRRACQAAPISGVTPCNSKRRRNSSIWPAWWPI